MRVLIICDLRAVRNYFLECRSLSHYMTIFYDFNMTQEVMAFYELVSHDEALLQ